MKQQLEDTLQLSRGLIGELQNPGTPIHRLIEIESMLAGYAPYFGEELTDLELEKMVAEDEKKAALSIAYNNQRSISGTSSTDADRKGFLDIKAERKREIETEIEFKKLKRFMEGLDKVLLSLTHRIKNLEGEQARAGKV
jgi:hypothetical protein